MDKIGDLVLNLAVDQSPAVAQMDITWWVSRGTEFVVDHSLPKRSYQSVVKAFSMRNFFSLYRTVRQLRPDLAVVFYAPAWVSWLLWLARVPIRIGRLSQWYSYLTYTHGVRQSRSRSEQHESEYNWQLLHQGLMGSNLDLGPAPVDVKNLTLRAPTVDLDQFRLKPKQFVVVHPGMAGSAYNWPSQHYIQLIQSITDKMGKIVAITGTAGDRHVLEPLHARFDSSSKVVWLDEKLDTQELLGVLNASQAVVGPSTGVLHLAAALGRPTIGIYSPLRSHSSVRWGPRGPDVHVLAPILKHPDEKCGPDIMKSVTVDEVLAALQARVSP